MFTSTRGCAEPMLPFSELKAKVTLEGQKLTQKIFLNFNMYLNISETRKSICLKHKIYMKCHNQDMQVMFHNSVLHFDKVMPLFKSSNLHTIEYQTICHVRSINSILIEEFSLNFTQMFNSTRLCAKSMLPLCRLKVRVTLEGQN